MGDAEGRKCELELDGLSLIDVSSEDDCLLFSSFVDPVSNASSEGGLDDGVLGFFGNEHDCRGMMPVSSLQEEEQVLQPHVPPEPEKSQKGGKYNLRKSMAWNNAFFTSAGVLEPEELSSIIESNQKVEKHMLSTIQEDLHRSTESISTLQSDSTIEETQEPLLFEDIRASIQKSCKASDVANSMDTKEPGATTAAIIPPSSKLGSGISQNKMKLKASPKKSSIRAQGSLTAAKQVPIRPAVSEVVASKEPLSTSGSRPSKGLGHVSPMSTVPTKRSSLDVNKTKLQKDAKNIGGKGALGPKAPVMGRSKTVLPKPVASKASVRSSAMSKNELTSSCSSLESYTSSSSSSSYKSSLNPVTAKRSDSNPKSDKPPYMTRPTSKNVSRSISQPRNPHISTQAMSKGKLYSATSRASSVSEWSSDSSMTSTCSERAGFKVHKRSISNATDYTSDGLNSLNNSTDKSRADCDSLNNSSGVAPLASMKPTGLRMPAPKIGFFDGARTVIRTPTGNMQCHPGVPSGMPRPGRHNLSGSSSSARSGKLQSAKSLPQEFSNSKIETSNDSPRVSSQKIQGRMLLQANRVKQLKAEGSNNMKAAGKNSSPASVKDKTCPGSRKIAPAKDTKMVSDGKLTTSIDKNIVSPTKPGGEEITEANVIEGEVNNSTEQIGPLDSTMMTEIGKDHSANALFTEEKAAAAEEEEGVSGQKMFLTNHSSRHDGDGVLGEGNINMKAVGKNSSPASVKDKTSPGIRNISPAKDTKMICDEKLETSIDENIISPTKPGEEEITEANVIEGEVNNTAKQIGVLDSTMMIEIGKDISCDPLSPEQKAAAEEVEGVSGQKMLLTNDYSGHDGDGMLAEGNNDMKAAENNSSPASVQDKTSPGRRTSAPAEDTKMVSVGNLKTSIDESIVSPTKPIGEEIREANITKGEVNNSRIQIGTSDSTMMVEIGKDPSSDALSSEQNAAAEEVEGVSGQKMLLTNDNSGHDGDEMLADSTGPAEVVVQPKTASIPSPEHVPETNS